MKLQVCATPEWTERTQTIRCGPLDMVDMLWSHRSPATCAMSKSNYPASQPKLPGLSGLVRTWRTLAKVRCDFQTFFVESKIIFFKAHRHLTVPGPLKRATNSSGTFQLIPHVSTIFCLFEPHPIHIQHPSACEHVKRLPHASWPPVASARRGLAEPSAMFPRSMEAMPYQPYHFRGYLHYLN